MRGLLRLLLLAGGVAAIVTGVLWIGEGVGMFSDADSSSLLASDAPGAASGAWSGLYVAVGGAVLLALSRML